jgi:hypothetical protein
MGHDDHNYISTIQNQLQSFPDDYALDTEACQAYIFDVRWRELVPAWITFIAICLGLVAGWFIIEMLL